MGNQPICGRIAHTLPHLSLLLRTLIKLTRSLRPHLGGKQSAIVTDTLPPWINPTAPLSANEGRALARLLTALTTKSVSAIHYSTNTGTSGVESSKAESLAKPFSRHAAYVLMAYIEVLNDPLCTLSLGMRRELEPGIFVLCEMIGEGSRDALMVSALDGNGKAIMKALWKEFEKQRYVGGG